MVISGLPGGRRLFDELTPRHLLSLAPAIASVERRETIALLAAEGASQSLRQRGWATIEGAGHLAGRLAEIVEVLDRARLPHVALFAFDEAWLLGTAVRDEVRRVLGEAYEVIEDFWAFRIDRGRSGWAPHRGVTLALDRERPELVNVWIALSDAGVERSCMHFVPLDGDRAYQERRLDDVRVAPTAAAPVPLAAGSSLFWNANILHWGGACAPDAAGPRISMTFTLARPDALALAERPVIDGAALTPWQRIDAIARQISVYGDIAGIPADVAAWAAVNVALASRAPGP